MCYEHPRGTSRHVELQGGPISEVPGQTGVSSAMADSHCPSVVLVVMLEDEFGGDAGGDVGG